MPSDANEESASALFYVHQRTGCVLSATQLLVLLVSAVENPQGGANLNLGQMKAKKIIKV